MLGTEKPAWLRWEEKRGCVISEEAEDGSQTVQGPGGHLEDFSLPVGAVEII